MSSYTRFFLESPGAMMVFFLTNLNHNADFNGYAKKEGFQLSSKCKRLNAATVGVALPCSTSSIVLANFLVTSAFL